MMLEGKQAVALRKGGILESGKPIRPRTPKPALFSQLHPPRPRAWSNRDFRPGLNQAREEPRHLEIRGYGEVARIFEVPSRPQLEQLNDLHIWDAPLLDMRLQLPRRKTPLPHPPPRIHPLVPTHHRKHPRLCRLQKLGSPLKPHRHHQLPRRPPGNLPRHPHHPHRKNLQPLKQFHEKIPPPPLDDAATPRSIAS